MEKLGGYKNRKIKPQNQVFEGNEKHKGKLQQYEEIIQEISVE